MKTQTLKLTYDELVRLAILIETELKRPENSLTYNTGLSKIHKKVMPLVRGER